MWIIFSNNCTYCGGDIEDNFSSCGLAAAILLFPIGELYSLHENMNGPIQTQTTFVNFVYDQIIKDFFASNTWLYKCFQCSNCDNDIIRVQAS